jgi:3-dehydroquinate synthase
MIGAFYQPQLVLCDRRSIPCRASCRPGLAEVIKYGPIADMQFFDWLEQHRRPAP